MSRWAGDDGAMTAGDYLALLLMGLLGTGHCIGMCGPFVLAASAGGGGVAGVVSRNLAYQLGKTLTYVFLAVVFSLVGGWIAGSGMLPWLQNGMSAAVGLGMVALGLAYALEVRLSPGALRWVDGSRWCGAVGAVLRAPTWWRSVLIGWLNGFLPCGLSLMALVYAAGFGSVAGAAAGAALFGAATVPGLLLVALFGMKLLQTHRRWLLRMAGATLVVMGVLTIIRGVPVVHEWFHVHTVIPW
ncbi:MAG: sulfite exporter TauE/SafE family protein [Opitutaceae bacterium]|nr:sulfite exporter TauE/SafE family protein [Opitutaceae bacterium]